MRVSLDDKHPENTAEMKSTQVQKIQDEVYTCPICKHEVKKYTKGQHESQVKHRHMAERVITGSDGVEKLDVEVVD